MRLLLILVHLNLNTLIQITQVTSAMEQNITKLREGVRQIMRLPGNGQNEICHINGNPDTVLSVDECRSGLWIDEDVRIKYEYYAKTSFLKVFSGFGEKQIAMELITILVLIKWRDSTVNFMISMLTSKMSFAVMDDFKNTLCFRSNRRNAQVLKHGAVAKM